LLDPASIYNDLTHIFIIPDNILPRPDKYTYACIQKASRFRMGLFSSSLLHQGG
jgi:hypothetical protein